MRRILIVLIAAIALSASSSAQESVTLTAPVPAGNISTWQVTEFHIDLLPSPRVTLEVKDNLGNLVRDTHDSTTTPSGATLLAALNTANLSTAGNSLIARLLKHLQNENKIGAGSVTGTPQ